MTDLLELTGRAEATHFWFHGFRAYVAPALERAAAGRRDLRLLDCGCGTGYNLSLLEPYGQTFAFDLAPEAMGRARRSGRPPVRANIEHIPFRDATFDIATSFDVLQTVPDDRRAVREIARVLKPGGQAVFNVTALELMRGDHSEVWGERRRYTSTSAKELVGSAGLEPVRISYLFASLLPLMLAVRTGQKLMRVVRQPKGDADLTVPITPINATLTWLVRREAALARRFEMPFGSSLLIVARKR